MCKLGFCAPFFLIWLSHFLWRLLSCFTWNPRGLSLAPSSFALPICVSVWDFWTPLTSICLMLFDAFVFLALCLEAQKIERKAKKGFWFFIIFVFKIFYLTCLVKFDSLYPDFDDTQRIALDLSFFFYYSVVINVRRLGWNWKEKEETFFVNSVLFLFVGILNLWAGDWIAGSVEEGGCENGGEEQG